MNLDIKLVVGLTYAVLYLQSPTYIQCELLFKLASVNAP